MEPQDDLPCVICPAGPPGLRFVYPFQDLNARNFRGMQGERGQSGPQGFLKFYTIFVTKNLKVHVETKVQMEDQALKVGIFKHKLYFTPINKNLSTIQQVEKIQKSLSTIKQHS